MPAVPATTLRMSPRDYFAWVAEQDEKHEYYDGEVFAMAGGSFRHSVISANIVAALRAAMRPKGCTTSSSDLRVQLTHERRYVYPDATVVCGEPAFLDDDGMTLTNPTLVVEVLSKTTRDFDAGTKATWYREIPSLEALLLVRQDAPAVSLYHREADRWTVQDARGLGAVLDVLGAPLALADVYDGADASA